MRFISAVLTLCLLLSPGLSSATELAAKSDRVPNIDLLLDRAIAENQIAGGVVVIGNHDGILATSARGRVSDIPGAPPITEHTIFDLASLTKVVATTPAVMKLLDEGRINVSDPISRYLPEFAAAGRNDITVFNLLTHTSGLDDVTVHPGQPIQSVVQKAASERGKPRPGSHFHYADINFILLAEMVHRVSGETLDNFCKEQIYGPLGTQETMFLPPRTLVAAIAPTSGYVGGVVQDNNARHLGGVAGHAGLFSSAYDLSVYARMLLGGGTLGETRVISGDTFTRMTTPYSCNNGAVRRGLGWDMDSPFAAPKVSSFSAASFGHTGYSGSSIWIDPQQDLFVILLTRRLNYNNTHTFNQLRRDVSTMAAADFRTTGQEGAAVAAASKGAGQDKAVVVADAKAPAHNAYVAVADATSQDQDHPVLLTNLKTFEQDGKVVVTNLSAQQQARRVVAVVDPDPGKVQALAAAYPAIQQAGRVMKAPVAPRHKFAAHQQRVGRHFARTTAKCSSGRKGTHIRLAKAEAAKSLHRKKRTLAKS